MQIVADNTYRPTTSYVKCIGAETQFYKTGQRYKVFKRKVMKKVDTSKVLTGSSIGSV